MHQVEADHLMDVVGSQSNAGALDMNKVRDGQGIVDRIGWQFEALFSKAACRAAYAARLPSMSGRTSITSWARPRSIVTSRSQIEASRNRTLARASSAAGLPRAAARIAKASTSSVGIGGAPGPNSTGTVTSSAMARP